MNRRNPEKIYISGIARSVACDVGAYQAYDKPDVVYTDEYVRADLVPQWQPIETAPKDGTTVMVWNKGVGFWIAAWRLPEPREPQSNSHYKHEWRDFAGCFATPTHWTPLQRPPKW